MPVGSSWLQPCVKENSVIWGLRNASSPSSLSNKSCYKTKCITDIFIAFFFPIFILGLVLTNPQRRPWGSALPCLQDTSIWGGSESTFWKKNNQPNIWQHGAYLGWLQIPPAPWSWSCSPPERRRLLQRGKLMCCRAELLLNLSNKVLTEALRVLCHFIPEITQTMLKDLLFSQDPLRCISDVYHTASCCTILVCNALDQHSTELQHIQIGFF